MRKLFTLLLSGLPLASFAAAGMSDRMAERCVSVLAVAVVVALVAMFLICISRCAQSRWLKHCHWRLARLSSFFYGYPLLTAMLLWMICSVLLAPWIALLALLKLSYDWILVIVGVVFCIQALIMWILRCRRALLDNRKAFARLFWLASYQIVGYVVYGILLLLPPFRSLFRVSVDANFDGIVWTYEPSLVGIYANVEMMTVWLIISFLIFLPLFILRFCQWLVRINKKEVRRGEWR